MTERNSSIDAIKGFLIICVIYGHFNYTLLSNTGPQQVAIFINELVYLFHMPLFLAVSFIFVKPLTWKTFKHYSKKILIPYFFWVLIFFQSVNTPDTLLNRFKATFFGTYAMGASIFWFFTVLYGCKLLLSYYARLTQHKQIYFWWILNPAIVLIYIFYYTVSDPSIASLTPFNILMSLYLFPMLFFVNYIYSKKKRVHSLTSSLILILMICGLSTYLILFSPKMPLHRLDLATFIIPHRLDSLFSIIVLWVAILLFLDILFSKSHSFVKYLSRVGFYSLPIFILHVPIKQFLEDYLLKAIPESWILGRVFVALLIIIGTYELCILISWLMASISDKFNLIGFIKRQKTEKRHS